MTSLSLQQLFLILIQTAALQPSLLPVVLYTLANMLHSPYPELFYPRPEKTFAPGDAIIPILKRTFPETFLFSKAAQCPFGNNFHSHSGIVR